MDPDATLARMRELQLEWLSAYRRGETDPDVREDIADELFACVEDLDAWLSIGGFLPKAWER